MGKVKYPNPKFFKAKDRMDWAAQAENLKLVGGIFYFNYPGGSGLMSGIVFGKIAGTGAAAGMRNA